jgi:hypothetical protein
VRFSVSVVLRHKFATFSFEAFRSRTHPTVCGRIPVACAITPGASVSATPFGPDLPIRKDFCQVRAILRREAYGLSADIELLMLERMGIIDTYSWWQKSTMGKYGPYLNFISRFGTHYGVPLLVPSRLERSPLAEAIPLMWSELLYSLRETEGQRIKHGTVRALRSAALLFYTLDQQAAFAGRLRRTNKRHETCETVAPNEDVMATFATKGMARRMGTAPKGSWALSHVHTTYIDRRLHELYQRATTETERHEFAFAGMANLSAYLRWLRGT